MDRLSNIGNLESEGEFKVNMVKIIKCKK